MKNIFFLFSTFFLLMSCGNEVAAPNLDPAEQLALEIANIKNYLTANNLTAEESNTGLHYIIEEPGSGNFISDGSTVNILLTGYFLDGSTFDQTVECTPATFSVSELISGIREGLTNFSVGGKGTLIIPSALAFGQNANGPIPANSTVVFDFEVVDLQPFEREKMKAYLVEKNLLDQADSTTTGIYYVIEEPGEGENPSSTSTVTVNYRGYYLYGDTFDQSNTPATFALTDVILGWREAIPLLKPGGRATFLIPSERGYGSTGNASVPGNSVLLFDVELIEFRD